MTSWAFVPKPVPTPDEVQQMNEQFALVDAEPVGEGQCSSEGNISG